MLFRKLARDVYCWAVAILFVGLIWLGYYMVGLHFLERWYHDSLAAHRSLGMIMLLLVLFKLAWIVYTEIIRSRFVAGIFFKRYTHIFYLLALVINLTGYLVSTSAMAPVSVFGLFKVPAIISVKKELLELLIGLHYYLAYGAVFFVLAHALMRLAPRIRAFRSKRASG